MGIDWGRLVGLSGPPAEGSEESKERVGGVLLPDVWARYRAIMLEAKAKGMKIMLTLFHHSMPRYLEPRGGWTNATTLDDWTRWVDAIFESIGNDQELSAAIEYVLTMNEAHVFALFTYCAYMWPPARTMPLIYEQASCFTPWGNYGVAMNYMAKAHSVAFDAIRTSGLKARVGSAHNVATYEALSVMDQPGRAFTEAMTTYWFQVKGPCAAHRSSRL
jgi:beta-glucosidase